jgi:hypothetical protein
VIDGEIFAYRAAARPSFDVLQTLATPGPGCTETPLTADHYSKDLTRKTLEGRRELLRVMPLLPLAQI